MNTYVIIGSGPSLTKNQINYLFSQHQNVTTIATNNNYKLAPWADYVFASDLRWWREYYDDVCDTVENHTELRTIEGVTKPLFKNRKERIPLYWDYVFRDFERLSSNPFDLYHGGCSGLLAMEYVRLLGEVNEPKKIILIGFDMQHTEGKTHWFGDHPKGFINANACDRWIYEIEKMMPHYRQFNIDVVNCSLQTAIPDKVVRRNKLEEELK